MTSKHVVRLGGISLAKLAVYAELEDALAERITIELRDDHAHLNPHQAPPAFTPTAKLKRSAARGIAAIVAAANAQFSGVTAADVTERLTKLGVDADTARRVAALMAGRNVLATSDLPHAALQEAINAVLIGAQLTDERI